MASEKHPKSPFVVINKVLLEQKQGHFVYMMSGCFPIARTELIAYAGDCMALEASKHGLGC